MPLTDDYAIQIIGLNGSGTVSVNVFDEGAEEELSRDGQSASRTFLVNWTNRVSLYAGLYGGAVVSGTSSAYLPPAQYPDLPWLYCQSVATPEGVGVPSVGPNGMIAYPWARVRATYKPLEFQAGAEKGSEDWSYSAEMLHVQTDAATWVWAGDSVDLDPKSSPGVLMITGTLTKAVKSLGAVPDRTALYGKLNNATFLGKDAGTMRFDGMDTTHRFIVGGSKNFDATYKFSWNPVGWNKFLRPSTGVFEAIQTKAGGNPPYAMADFSVFGF